MAFLAGIADQLGPGGRALTLLPAAPADGSMPARDVAIDGALVYSCHSDSSAVSWLMRRRLPVVFVDQAAAPGIPSVNVDDRAGARAAAQHLVDLGHRRVGIVTTGFGGELRHPGRPAGHHDGQHRAATAARLDGRSGRGRHHPDGRTAAAQPTRRRSATTGPDCSWSSTTADCRPLLLRRHRRRRHRRDPGQRSHGARRHLGRRLRRQPDRRADPTSAHHRAAGLAGQGPGRDRAAGHRSSTEPARPPAEAGPAPRAADRAGRPRQHRNPPARRPPPVQAAGDERVPSDPAEGDPALPGRRGVSGAIASPLHALPTGTLRSLP